MALPRDDSKSFTVEANTHTLFVMGLSDHNRKDFRDIFSRVTDKPLDEALLASFLERPDRKHRHELAAALIDSLRRGQDWLPLMDKLEALHKNGYSQNDMFIWLLHTLPVGQQWRLLDYFNRQGRAFPIIYHILDSRGDLEARSNFENCRRIMGGDVWGKKTHHHSNFVLSLGSLHCYGKSTLLNRLFYKDFAEVNAPAADGNKWRYPMNVTKNGSLHRVCVDLQPDRTGETGFHLVDTHGSDDGFLFVQQIHSSSRPHSQKTGLINFVRGMAQHCAVFLLQICPSRDLLKDGSLAPGHDSLEHILGRYARKCMVIFRDDKPGTSRVLEAEFKKKYPSISTYSSVAHVLNMSDEKFDEAVSPLLSSIHSTVKKSSGPTIAFNALAEHVTHGIAQSEDRPPEITTARACIDSFDIMPSKLGSRDVVEQAFPLQLLPDDTRKLKVHAYQQHALLDGFVTTASQNQDLALEEFMFGLDVWKGHKWAKLQKERHDFLRTASVDTPEEVEKLKKMIQRISQDLLKLDLHVDRMWTEIFLLQQKMPAHPLLKSAHGFDFAKGFANAFKLGRPVRLIDVYQNGRFCDVALGSLCATNTSSLVVVSCIGSQQSGKSFLLNSLFGTRFEVAGGRTTLGIEAAYAKPIHHGVPDLVCLDTEGLLTMEHADNCLDEKLIEAALSLSHVVLINVVCTPDESNNYVLDPAILKVVSTGLTHWLLMRDRNGAAVVGAKPRLVFVLRDTNQKADGSHAEISDDTIEEMHEQVNAMIQEACATAQKSRRDYLSVESVFAMSKPEYNYSTKIGAALTHSVLALPSAQFADQVLELREAVLSLCREVAYEFSTSYQDWWTVAHKAWNTFSSAYATSGDDEKQEAKSAGRKHMRVASTMKNLFGVTESNRISLEERLRISRYTGSEIHGVLGTNVVEEATSPSANSAEQRDLKSTRSDHTDHVHVPRGDRDGCVANTQRSCESQCLVS